MEEFNMLTLVVSETCLTVRLHDRQDKTRLPTMSWMCDWSGGCEEWQWHEGNRGFSQKTDDPTENKNEAVLKKVDKTSS